MPNPTEDSRRARILAFLETQTSPLGVGAIVTAASEPGETQDATRWTSCLATIAAEGLIETTGNYRKKYLVNRISAHEAAAHKHMDEISATGIHRGDRTDAEFAEHLRSVSGLDAPAPRMFGLDPQRTDELQAPLNPIAAYDRAADFFGAAPADHAVKTMLAASRDPSTTGEQMRELVDESVRQESELRGVPEHLLTGSEPPPPEVLADVRIPAGTYFSETFGNFYDAHTGFGMGPQFKERWWVRRDEFPTADDYGRNSDEPVDNSTSYADAVGSSTKNTVLHQTSGSSSDPDWLEVVEVYRAATRLRAANTGWGIDAGLDADVREARALLAEVRHQIANDAPVGEHYREGEPTTEPPRPASSDQQPWAE